MAALPHRPAQPVVQVTVGPGKQGREQAGDLVQ
jgi:hypothetical protein